MNKTHSLVTVLKKFLIHQKGIEFYKTVKTFAAGETIFSPEKPTERIYFLLEGAVKLSRIDRAGKEIPLILLPPNNLFGVLSSISDSVEGSYSAVAWSPVSLFFLTNAQFQQVLKEFPELPSLIVMELSQRLLRSQKMIDALAQRDLFTRLTLFLLLLCDDFGIETEAGILIKLKLTHQNIANLIRANRPSITRLLRLLRSKQIISIYKRTITVHDPQVLSRYHKESLLKEKSLWEKVS
ncbi:cyclic nucleotide-binding domain-containing protein [Pleurocapsales cyanobacterium LEGE 06147]|nr:cyclic nucleotide-binding domain-containing protein [Pleurocapsales cyanobacterium LEGE 06147]